MTNDRLREDVLYRTLLPTPLLETLLSLPAENGTPVPLGEHVERAVRRYIISEAGRSTSDQNDRS